MGCNQFEGNLTSSLDLTNTSALAASYNEALVPSSGTESLRRIIDLELQAGPVYLDPIPWNSKRPAIPQQPPSTLVLTGSLPVAITGSAQNSGFLASVTSPYRDFEASFNYSFQQQARLIDLAQCYFFVPLS